MHPLWPCVPLLHVSCGHGARGADCDGGVCTGVIAGLQTEEGKCFMLYMCCSTVDKQHNYDSVRLLCLILVPLDKLNHLLIIFLVN